MELPEPSSGLAKVPGEEKLASPGPGHASEAVPAQGLNQSPFLPFFRAALDSSGFLEEILFKPQGISPGLQPFHREWLAFQQANPTSLILAPRGHGKSTILTVGYSLLRLALDREARILIVSNTQDQASGFLREIKSNLEGAALAPYGPFQARPWSDTQVMIQRRLKAKESSLTALGVGGPVISRHFEVIILDDVVDEENSRTHGQREKLKHWFQTSLLPTLVPGGELHLIGTRYHYLDLYGFLLGAGGYPTLISRALDAEQGPLWPERFSREWLERKRAEMGGGSFNAQFQNDVAAMKGRIFRAEWIKTFHDLPKRLKLYQGVDLAISQKTTADYFAHCTIGKDAEGKIYVLSCLHSRLSFEKQFELIQELFRQRQNPDRPVIRVAIEANAYQEAMIQRLKAYSDLPVKGVRTVKDKISRGLILQSKFESGDIFFTDRGPCVEDLIDELLLFPEGQHDDLFDALALAVEEAGQLSGYDQLPMVFGERGPDS